MPACNPASVTDFDEMAIDQSTIGCEGYRHYDGRFLRNQCGHDDTTHAGCCSYITSREPCLRVHLIYPTAQPPCHELESADGTVSEWSTIQAVTGEPIASTFEARRNDLDAIAKNNFLMNTTFQDPIGQIQRKDLAPQQKNVKEENSQQEISGYPNNGTSLNQSG